MHSATEVSYIKIRSAKACHFLTFEQVYVWCVHEHLFSYIIYNFIGLDIYIAPKSMAEYIILKHNIGFFFMS